MTDANQGTKKRITVCATPEGVYKAEKALIRLEFDSKSSFAKSRLLAKSSVDNFFTGKPIQLDTFKKICEELTLDWMGIADMAEPESSTPRERHQEALRAVGGEVATSKRQVTVVDAQTEKVKAMVVLEGDLDSLPNLTILTTILRAYSGDSINIVDIQQGSIRLIIEGSSEDIERLLSRFEAGEITELNGFPVEDLQILDDSSDANAQRLNNKWDLVRETFDQKHAREKSSDTELENTRPSGAYSSGHYIGTLYRGASATVLNTSVNTVEEVKLSIGERVVQLKNMIETLRIADEFANKGYLITSSELADLMNIDTGAVTARGDHWSWRNWVVSRVRREGNQILWQLERID